MKYTEFQKRKLFFGRSVFVFLVFCAGLMVGCAGEEQKRESDFDIAEAAYRIGQYETAHVHYAAFLRGNPDPQLARLAERRILSIEREIGCVLGKKNGPKPEYVNRAADGESVPVQYPRVLNRAGRATMRD